MSPSGMTLEREDRLAHHLGPILIAGEGHTLLATGAKQGQSRGGEFETLFFDRQRVQRSLAELLRGQEDLKRLAPQGVAALDVVP
ncbi:MAG TPA: hypothetical protein VNR65_16985 [Geobacterales bacterium]|nr:hypothetical protein [Geobacterales bacterium]